MKIFLFIFINTIALCWFFSFPPIVNAGEVISEQTQLEKRQFQTRNYNNIKKEELMKAMLNVLQDEGYIVSNANAMLGFISGTREFSPRDKTVNIQKELGTTTKRWLVGATVIVIEVTVNVAEFGKQNKVRVNFRRKYLNEYGNAIKIEEVSETYYQNFFSKVDKAVFIENQKI